ncbi:hypothetical protein EDL79_02380 [Ehrlichia ruminantium]|uniref:Uncharacterized protein n=1 Tax=Ehrlichia ruminantium TaxID=779 RepID=A0AAE6QBB0_EHRRU|nr:hypothetical protein [Ehrlichia ruminantium]QGR02980.1 hypothetical protein EDL81_02340 [Ehrlichia ruminantium]QGR03426.1 hypothetical protein EDL80_02435 [Ehrlichia ruminantium]QGR04829.1 hypothetical protein EDL79_02380 [Ehrlichia ruminantium]
MLCDNSSCISFEEIRSGKVISIECVATGNKKNWKVVFKYIDNKNSTRYEKIPNSEICIVALTVKLPADQAVYYVYLKLNRNEVEGFNRVFFFPILQRNAAGLEFRRPIEEDYEVISILQASNLKNRRINELSILNKLDREVYIKTKSERKLCCIPCKKGNLILCSELIERYMLEGVGITNVSGSLESNISILNVECVASGNIRNGRMILKYIDVDDKKSCEIPSAEVYIFALVIELCDYTSGHEKVLSYLRVDRNEMYNFCSSIYYPVSIRGRLELRTSSPLSEYGKVISTCQISCVKDYRFHELLVLKELGEEVYVETTKNYKFCCMPYIRKKLISCKDIVHNYILQQNENPIYENLKLSSEMLYSEIQERQNVDNVSVVTESSIFDSEHIYEEIDNNQSGIGVITHPVVCCVQNESVDCFRT